MTIQACCPYGRLSRISIDWCIPFQYKIYKVELKKSSLALLPNDEAMEEEWCKLVEQPFNKSLTNRLLAVSEALEVEDIPGAACYGFVVVLNVAADNSSITVLSPGNEEPPNNILVYTDVQYVDM